ncbi:MAG: phosphodiester glycosidase family protein [Phycisphaerales bacterium]|nr:MAG: phosphodiester glycosidase family protein [Phycisphaerales bacterium]
MKKQSVTGGFALLWSVLVCAPVLGQWQSVAPGIDYQEFTLPDPNNLFVARLDRSDLNCTIDSYIAQGRLTGGTETVSSMAARHEGAIGYWGQSWGMSYDVVAAINGDFYSGEVPISGQISSGWYAKRFSDFTGGSGFAWQLDRDAFIGECVRHIASKQKVTYTATGQDQNINGVNVPRDNDELVVYTHHYDLTTGTNNAGSEVLVQMSRPTLILPLPAGAVGTVVEIRTGAGSTVIPFDHVVLSAHGTAATKLLANVSLGSEVKISQEITHYEHDCSTPYGWDWTKTYASIGGSFHFLKGGVVQTFTDPGATQRHPRTAVAFNNDYIFFVVVDGRSVQSVGMSMTELGNFCLNYLSAVEGINQDGGGSSTMWVNGQVMNVPSDGTERPVANGLMMVVVQPMDQSPRFAADDELRTVSTVSARVGPGTNYAAAASVPSGTQGVVLSHSLGGVLATGEHWWRCEFGSTVGWVPDNAVLEGDCAGDYTSNGYVEMDDLPEFVFCMQGPDITYAPGAYCLAGDGDGDLDVDLGDFAVFQRCFAVGGK